MVDRTPAAKFDDGRGPAAPARLQTAPELGPAAVVAMNRAGHWRTRPPMDLAGPEM